MRKKLLSLLLAICLVIPCALSLTACGDSKYTALDIEYTADLEFLVGEEYIDNGLKATATTDKGKTEDVTSKVTINSSEYNKNVVGKYKIYVELDELKKSYEVSVVERLTGDASLNRFKGVIQNTFGDGAYSFSMTTVNTVSYTVIPITQNIQHSIDADGNILSYVKWSAVDKFTNPNDVVEYLIYEAWYKGTVESGVTTIRTTSDNINYTVVTTQQSFAEFNSDIESRADTAGYPANNVPVLLASNVVALTSDNLSLIGELTKTGDIYLFATNEAKYIYKDNKLQSIDGMNIIFNNVSIPEIPEVTE